MTEEVWKSQVEALGEFIRTQRKLAKLSLRELAARGDLERVAFLLEDERDNERAAAEIEPAIRDRPRLTPAQRRGPARLYRGFASEPQSSDQGSDSAGQGAGAAETP